MGLDLKSAQLVVQCARLGSIGKAAEALNITQPAAARLLLRLEQRLGVTLFERSAKGVTPTHYGKALVPHAALVASEAALADEVVTQMRGSARGLVRVAAATSVADGPLREAILLLSDRLPDVQFQIHDGIEDVLIDALKEGRVDLAISTEPYDDDQISLACPDAFFDEVRVVARPQNPVHGLPFLTMEEAAQHQWATPPEDTPVAREWRRRFRAAGIDPPEPRLTCRSIRVIKNMALDSDTLCWMPLRTIQLEMQHGLLVKVETPQMKWRRTFRIYRRVRGALSPTASQLLRAMQEIARREALTLTGPA